MGRAGVFPTGFLINNSKIQFNGDGGHAEPHQLQLRKTLASTMELVMSNTAVKLAFAMLLALVTPAASFAQTGRMAGAAGSGNLPISGIAPGPANAGGMNNVMVDPSGIGNASRMAPLPSPRITVPAVPKFK